MQAKKVPNMFSVNFSSSKKMGIFRKKNITPCCEYRCFWSWIPPSDFQSILPWLPWNFPLFALTFWKCTFFSQILASNSNCFYYNPLEFSIDTLTRGLHILFLEKPITLTASISVDSGSLDFCFLTTSIATYTTQQYNDKQH